MEENKLNFKNAFLLTAVVAILVISSMIYKGSSTEAVHIEINESVAISVNRLGKVINSYAFDEDGEKGISLIKTENRKYPDVIEDLLSKSVKDGIFEKGEKIPVRIWTEESSVNDRYKIIERNVKEAATNASMTAQCAELDKGITGTAEKYGISVGKYRMICEMQKMDSGIQIDVYKDYSLPLLRRLYNLLSEGATKEQAEDTSGARSGGIRETVNKILFESEKSE
ncbi:MAG: hypothetical protein Q4G33_07215 [bacterium]|nr:hypothetical protein [bacterium]